MYIVILGAGKTGSHLARVLSEDHDVILIDQDPKSLEEASRHCDIATMHAIGPDPKLFEDLTEHRPTLFFAATGDDETNLISCCIAKNLGFPKTIARIKRKEYLNYQKLDFHRLFSIDHFMGAEILTAQNLFNEIVYAGDVASDHFAHGAIQMRTLQIPDEWDRGGVSIKDLEFPSELMIGLIRRRINDGEKILFPQGHDHILPGDEITVVGESKIMQRLHEIFKSPKRKVRSVMLIGGTEVALQLAEFLIHQGISVRVIEKDGAKCEKLAERFSQVTIIHRDGKDLQLLQSERVQDTDAFVCCLRDDGNNFFIASLAKQLGCKKAIALITDSSYSPILEKMGITPALSAQVNVANRIVSILHEEAILSVRSLGCDAAKIVELKVAASSPIVGIPLSDLRTTLPKDLLIAVIENKGRVMIGKGNRILSPDDTVIAICPPHQISQIPPLFHR